jgi:hypothetical protein
VKILYFGYLGRDLSKKYNAEFAVQQIGYAFSYASGPICFLKVPASASKFLATHWRRPQNYVAYIIYSLHRAPHMDNKRQGLEMVNELAARGFIEDTECNVHEETVQATRAVSFQKGNIVVSVPKLGGSKAFRGYWPSSEVDDEDRKTISDRLQNVMHDRALLTQTSTLTASPSPTKCSDDSNLQGTTLTASESPGDLSSSSGGDTPLEGSGLIKFVKVHWKQSKWIKDNINLIRTTQLRPLRSSTGSEETEEENDNFKAVIVWSNKTERKQGVKLLERLIGARMGENTEDHMKDVMVHNEVMEDGEGWVVFHKNNVAVGFPGEDGEDDFIEGVEALEQVFY